MSACKLLKPCSKNNLPEVVGAHPNLLQCGRVCRPSKAEEPDLSAKDIEEVASSIKMENVCRHTGLAAEKRSSVATADATTITTCWASRLGLPA